MNPYEGMVIERPLYESLLLLDLTDKLENQCTHYWSTVQHVQHEKDRSHLVSVYHVSALQKALDAAHWVLTILSALKRVKSLPAKSVPVFSVVSLSLLDFVNFNKCVWLYWCFWREVWVCPYVRERERVWECFMKCSWTYASYHQRLKAFTRCPQPPVCGPLGSGPRWKKKKRQLFEVEKWPDSLLMKGAFPSRYNSQASFFLLCSATTPPGKHQHYHVCIMVISLWPEIPFY